MLTNRINIFVSLPLAKLDHLSLQTQLEAIGKTKDAAAGVRPPQNEKAPVGRPGASSRGVRLIVREIERLSFANPVPLGCLR